MGTVDHSYPRLAIGATGGMKSTSAMMLSLVAAVRQLGMSVQVFASQAKFSSCESLSAVAGQSSRHLDSWLMDAATCQRFFLNSANAADLSLVQGAFGGVRSPHAAGGKLEPLCDWLQLPRLAVIDVTQADSCRVAEDLADADGVILDRVLDNREYLAYRTTIESLYRVPVLGWLPEMPAAREMILSMPVGESPGRELSRELGQQLLRHLAVDRLMDLAHAHPLTLHSGSAEYSAAGHRRPNIAVAYDDAFQAYFPDTLDLLEFSGAEIHVFSPLKSDELPHRTDVVYFGCGRPEQYAAELSSNRCMHSALQRHVACGGRVYAECAGLAYLCQQLVDSDGRAHSMAGLVPGYATMQNPGRAVEVTADERVLNKSCWLGSAGARFRGYLNPRWSIQTEDPQWNLATGPDGQCDLVACGPIVGSRLHLHFGAHPALFSRFMTPAHAV